MTGECWTTRYSPARVAPVPLTLKAPLSRAWKYSPKGAAPGFIRTGKGAVFTDVGQSRATRLDLQSGKAVWIETGKHTVCLITRWKEELLVFGNSSLRSLDLASGAVKWQRECQVGLESSFVVDDLLVGKLAEHFHVLDLNTLEYLWKVRELASNLLVSDGNIVIRGDDDVTCFDLRSGAVRWQRPKADFGGEGYRPGCIWGGQYIAILADSLTSLDIATGRTIWRWQLPDVLHWWHPYGGRAYCFLDGVYVIVDMATGKVQFERSLGPKVPAPVKGKKSGLRVRTRGRDLESWRDVRVVVSETHAFLQNASGQIVVLGRETGEVEQIVEVDGMPLGAEPVIYERRLLLADFNAAVYCFQGAE